MGVAVVAVVSAAAFVVTPVVVGAAPWTPCTAAAAGRSRPGEADEIANRTRAKQRARAVMMSSDCRRARRRSANNHEPCSAGFTLTTQTDGTRLTQRITVEGAPQSVEVQESIDGTSVFDKTVSPAYQTSQPNGPNCAPICRQATAAWTIPG